MNGDVAKPSIVFRIPMLIHRATGLGRRELEKRMMSLGCCLVASGEWKHWQVESEEKLHTSCTCTVATSQSSARHVKCFELRAREVRRWR